MNNKARVLMVDDEQNVLEGFRRYFSRRYDLYLANSGIEGLKIIEETDPFAVVVSDIKMPKMNGVTFLEKVHQRLPTTTRMILTGRAELGTVIAAVNEGRVHYFLTKPNEPTLLIKAIDDGILAFNKRENQSNIKASFEVVPHSRTFWRPG